MSTSPLTLIEGDSDIAATARLLSFAFGGPPAASEDWVRKAVGNIRLMRQADGTPVACANLIPMGQYFGGRSLPMIGIAGVAVAPEARGQGLARTLMRAVLSEIRSKGVALSALYASTQTLYRQVGYEQAGSRFTIRLPLSRIDAGVRDRKRLPVAALGEADTEAIRRCYNRFARRFDGALDRGPYIWNRIALRRDDVFTPFGIRDGAEIQGYIFMNQSRKTATGRYDVTLSDVAFDNESAGRRLLALLADFATVGDDLTFFGAPNHPLLALLAQQVATVTLHEQWMLRVVDPARAIGERGFAEGVTAEVHLVIADELFPENAGRFVLRVADGRGVLTPGGRGEVDISTRSVPQLFSGFRGTRAMELLGQVSGPAPALAQLDAAFPQSSPWLVDFF